MASFPTDKKIKEVTAVGHLHIQRGKEKKKIFSTFV